MCIRKISIDLDILQFFFLVLEKTQRNQFMEGLRSAIRDIIGSILFTPDVCIEDSPNTVALCLSLERILLHRLQSKLIFA